MPLTFKKNSYIFSNSCDLLHCQAAFQWRWCHCHLSCLLSLLLLHTSFGSSTSWSVPWKIQVSFSGQNKAQIVKWVQGWYAVDVLVVSSSFFKSLKLHNLGFVPKKSSFCNVRSYHYWHHFYEGVNFLK